MLLRFGVANHLSIRDHQELSLSASSLGDSDDGLIECAAAPRGMALPAAVVYGANASGKTNLVAAMEAMCSMVLLSHSKGEPGGGVPRQPFALGAASARAPSRFDIDFVLDGVRHHYGFEATDDAFVSEWLYAFPKSHRRTLFERDGEDFRFGRLLKGQNAVVARLTRPNSLYLSAAAQNRHEYLSSVFGYFRSIRGFRNVAAPGEMATARLAEDGVDTRTIEFLRKIGTGIVDFRRMEAEDPEEARTFQREILAVLRRFADAPVEAKSLEGDKFVAIELAHRGQDGAPVYFELDRESAGTRRLLIVLGLAFNAIDEGVPLFVDELDASLHTHASEAVLRLFCSRKTNPKGAQLVATAHDTGLISSPALRRDQLWFTEKDASGATQLYPLTDYRTRKADNIEKGYRQGRYGAVPFDDPISTLGTPN